MKTRTYEAATLREAMRQVQDELGPEAVILGTRALPSPREDEPPRFQVTASGPGPQAGGGEGPKRYPDPPETRRRERPRAPEPEETPPPLPRAVPEPAPRPRPRPAPAEEGDEPPDAATARALDELRDAVRALAARDAGPDAGAPLESLRAEVQALARALEAARASAPGADPLAQQLVAAGVEAPLAAALVARARSVAAPPEGLAVAVPPDLEAALARALPVATPLWARDDRPVAALVGPTGAGKTRTVAKLAALATFHHARRVGLITTDVKRIGGLEPLRAFCEVLHLPLRRAATGRALRLALDAMGRVDLVLIDTPGVGPWDEAGLARLADVLGAAGAERHLVVPAATPADGARTLARRLAPGGLASVIVTKLDEARGPGAVLSAPWGTGAPLSHVCDGQTVPDACAEADAPGLARRILARAA